MPRQSGIHGAGARTDPPDAAGKESRMSTLDDAAARGAPRRKLGKGLGALLGEARREEPLVRPVEDAGSSEPVTLPPRRSDGLANLPVAAIEPHPEQPRRQFDETALAELAASISERGVIQPVIVRPMGEGRYQLVAGER